MNMQFCIFKFHGKWTNIISSILVSQFIILKNKQLYWINKIHNWISYRSCLLIVFCRYTKQPSIYWWAKLYCTDSSSFLVGHPPLYTYIHHILYLYSHIYIISSSISVYLRVQWSVCTTKLRTTKLYSHVHSIVQYNV